MALRVRVCAIADVAPGERKGFAVAGLIWPVMVANLDGQIVATSSKCPHEDVSLLDGRQDGAIVTCRAHGYELDLRTGTCIHDPRLRLRCYKVTLVGEEVWVDLV